MKKGGGKRVDKERGRRERDTDLLGLGFPKALEIEPSVAFSILRRLLVSKTEY